MKGFEFTDDLRQKFNEDGYLVIEDYYESDLCDKLRRECATLIQNMDPNNHKTAFKTEHDGPHVSDKYFLTSGDKIRYFWEPEAIDQNGDLNRPKHLAVNKIGHALHFLNPAFKEATFTAELKEILRKFEYKRPVIPQSMYIFKQPNIGGTVQKHVDASFLDLSPLKLTGFWIALEDATMDNGCLYFAPGSHIGRKVTYKMMRHTNDPASEKGIVFEGEFEKLNDDKFVPVPVKKGSLVIIDGLVQHCSAKNVSDKSRHIYTFHVAESYNSEWSKRNWLQPTETPFPVVYDCSS